MANQFRFPVILIGPSNRKGLSIGKKLAAELEVPFTDLWELSEDYSKEVGFRKEKLDQAEKENKLEGVYQYLQPFFAHSIKRGIEEFNSSVIKLNAVQSAIDNDQVLQSVADIVSPFHVILLLPSQDAGHSTRLLQHRNAELLEGIELNEHFVTHRSNFELAKYTVYTKDRTPDQTAEEILQCIDTKQLPIVLIGAQSVGKSTVGKLLAENSGMPRVSMDELRWKYYKETQWSEEQQAQIAESEGFVGVYRYWKKFDLHAVKRIFQDHSDCVIDFGAGHSVYEQPEDLKRAGELLAPIQNIVHLIPSADIDESVEILRKRRAQTINGIELIEFLTTHPSNAALADCIVYTEERSEVDVVRDILHKLEFE